MTNEQVEHIEYTRTHTDTQLNSKITTIQRAKWREATKKKTKIRFWVNELAQHKWDGEKTETGNTVNGTVHRKIMHQHVQFIKFILKNYLLIHFSCFFFFSVANDHTSPCVSMCAINTVMICNYYYSADVFDRFFASNLMIVVAVLVGICYMLMLTSVCSLYLALSFNLSLSLTPFFSLST